MTLATDIFGSLFYHDDTGAGKCHFGILPLAYWHQGFTLPTSWPAAAMCLQAMQPATWDPAGQQKHIQAAQPTMQEAYSIPQQACSNFTRQGLIANQVRSQLHLSEHPQ